MPAAITTATDPVGEFNALLGAGAAMVRRLSTGSGAGTITSGTRLAEVGAFQRSWNTSRDLVVDELDAMVQDHTSDEFYEPSVGSLTHGVIVQGLEEDQKYGPNTAAALMLTLWARSREWEAPHGVPSRLLGIPTDPRQWPTVWASSQGYWTGLFTAVMVADPLPPAPPAPTPAPLPDVIAPPPPPAPAAEPLSFDDDTVYGQTRGSKSNTPVLIGGAALLLAGGVFAYASLKKKRR
jgi:hypothetical protein